MTSWILAMMAVSGCDDRSRRVTPHRDAGRPRRVIEPPSGAVHALPPHAIRADGVGPYRLGESLDSMMSALPSGPRLSVLDVRGVVRASIVRTEDDGVLLGGEPMMGASFAAVIAPKIARTEQGIEVGSSETKLLEAMGARAQERQVSDPRLFRFAGARGMTFVVEGEEVLAIVVGAEVDGSDSGGLACGLRAGRKDVPPCLLAGDAVTISGDGVVLGPPGAPERHRRAAPVPLPGLLFAGVPVDNERDLIAVRVDELGGAKRWLITVLRNEGGKLVRVAEEPLFSLTAESASLLGAALSDVDLLVRVDTRADSYVASGLLVTRTGKRLRVAVPLSPASVLRRRKGGEDGGAGSSAAPAEVRTAVPDAGPAM
jgi:hypothetical protein